MARITSDLWLTALPQHRIALISQQKLTVSSTRPGDDGVAGGPGADSILALAVFLGAAVPRGTDGRGLSACKEDDQPLGGHGAQHIRRRRAALGAALEPGPQHVRKPPQDQNAARCATRSVTFARPITIIIPFCGCHEPKPFFGTSSCGSDPFASCRFLPFHAETVFNLYTDLSAVLNETAARGVTTVNTRHPAIIGANLRFH